jgi:hypothetical protein
MVPEPQRSSAVEHASPRTRRPRRHPVWTVVGIAVALAIAVRAALPLAVAAWIERAAPRFVVGSVAIGDVDLALVRGVLDVEELSVYGPAEDPASGAGERWLHVVGLRLRIAWRPLLDRSLRIRELVLHEPFLALARSADGGLDLRTRLRSRDEPHDEARPGWRIAIEHGAIHGGRIRYRDLALDARDRLRLDLDRVETKRLSLEPGSFERPGRLLAEGTIAGAPFELGASVAPRRDGTFAIEGSVRAERVPLARAQAHLPAIGRFDEMSGRVALDLAFSRVPDERETLSGSVLLEDVVLRTDGLERPALEFRSLELVAETIDLAAHHAALRSATLVGPVVVVRTEPELTLPALVEDGEGRAFRDPPAQASASVDGAAPAWSWSLATLALDAGSMVLLGAAEPLELGVAGSAEHLGPDREFPLSLELRAPTGRAALAGRASIAPRALAGTLELEDVALPPLLSALGVARPALERATLGGALRVALPAAPSPGREHDAAPEPTLGIDGSLELTDVQLATEDPEAFSVAWDALDAKLADVRVPLASDAGPVTLLLEQLALRGPALKLRRTESGFVLPKGEARGDEAPRVELAIARVRVEDGALAIEDRTVEPFYREELTSFEGLGTKLRWPDLRVDSLRATLEGLGEAPAEITGTIAEGRVVLDVKGSRIALGPLNPYVTSYSDYVIEAGKLSLEADVEVDSREYGAQLDLRLHGLDLAGADQAFERDFGISLALGLALLRDVRGDIALAVPIRVDREGARVEMLSVIRSALSRAILNALTAPLQLVGAVVQRGGAVQTFEPEPIPFQPGAAVPNGVGRERLEDLAALLVEKPALAVVLRPVIVQGEVVARSQDGPPPPPTAAPEEPEREPQQDLLDRIGGWIGGDDERAGANPPASSSESASAAEPRVLTHPPPPHSTQRLAQARLEALRRWLVERHGVPFGRIVTEPEPIHAAAGPPRVEIALAPAGAG